MNYKDAAMRHYKDGMSLFEDRRFDNSDQLFGVAAECALKSCLRNRCYQGLQLDAQFLNHVNILWNKILIHIDSKAFPNVIALLNSRNRPFDDWNVAQRYESTGFITIDVCERHKKWAARIMGAAGLLGIRSDL